MPHATATPPAGIEAVILCGPGVSLNTFTSKPEDFPKALVPIANRPMVWYPLDWCYRMGISNIHLVTPPASEKVIRAALLQNPHLTSLPHPRADIIAPQSLTETTGTAEILRLPEVQAAITGDLLILPCDLVSELPGTSLIDSWITHASRSSSHAKPLSADTELGIKGGLGVWYDTRGPDHSKGTETDCIITTSASRPAVKSATNSIGSNISKLLFTSTSDTLRDVMGEKGGLPIRTGLVRKHGAIKMRTSHRAAHIYFLPKWLLRVIKYNEEFDSVSEDLVGWWAKASWQDGLAEKLHMSSLDSPTRARRKPSIDAQVHHLNIDDLMDTYSTTRTTSVSGRRVQADLPSMLCYVHPQASPFLIRRVDTPALLLSTSLRLAGLDPISDKGSESTSTPHSHSQKILTDASLIAPHTTIHAQNTLIAPNTSVATHCTIKSSCIGANCVIEEGVRMSGCLLMDGAKVGSKSFLEDSILGPRCVIGKGVKLQGCEVQQDYHIEDGRVGSKGEKFCIFEGLENGLESMQEDAPAELSEG